MSPKKTVKRQLKKTVKKTGGNFADFIRQPLNIVIIAGMIAASIGTIFAVNAAAESYFAEKWSFKTLFKFPSGKEAIPHIHLKEAYELFNKKNVLFVDARGGGEYDEAHIKGAVSIPAGTPADKITQMKEILKDKTLVAYCHGVGCHLSDKTAFALYDAGYRKIKIFFGGWNEWTAANYPLDKYEPPEQYRHLFNEVSSPEAAADITADEAKFLMDKNLGTIVDVDTEQQYMRVHIDRALSMPVEKMDTQMRFYQELFKQKPVIIYSHGSQKRLHSAAEKVFKAGGRKILLFTDALKKWEKAGYVLAKPQPHR